MNLLNFISQYPDEDSCKLKLKAIRDKEGSYAVIAVGKIIIGKGTSGNMNVKHVKPAQHFRVARLCMAHSYRFVTGLWQCTLLHLPRRVFRPLNFKGSWDTNTMRRYGQCYTSCVWLWGKEMTNIFFQAK